MTSIFAHRGLHRDWPENSVAAVAAAAEIGADGVEIDVWLTRDEHLVVRHDGVLGGHRLTAMTLSEIGRIAPVACLDEVLSAARDLRVNIEMKSTHSAPYDLSAARAVSEFLDSSPAPHRCLVSSFSRPLCEEVRRLSPQRAVGWLAQHRGARYVIDRAARSGLTSAHLPFSRMNPAAAQLATRRGIELHVWTANLRRDIDRMLELDVAALITDDVELALDLRRRYRSEGPGPRA